MWLQFNIHRCENLRYRTSFPFSVINLFTLDLLLTCTVGWGGGGFARLQPPNQNLEDLDFIDMMILNLVNDLPLS